LKTELFMFTDWLTELCEKLRTFSTFLRFLQKKMGTRFACFFLYFSLKLFVQLGSSWGSWVSQKVN
jgi:hypothetical protein